jgi:hypothetical protein
MDVPSESANSRGHWRARAGRRKRYFEAQDSRQLVGLIPLPPPQPLDRVAIRAHFHLWNAMDFDNLYGRFKDAGDWLVSRGYISSDSPVVVRSLTCSQEIDRRHDGRLVVEIEEVAGHDAGADYAAASLR